MNTSAVIKHDFEVVQRHVMCDEDNNKLTLTLAAFVLAVLRANGQTLSELLVVISVVTILEFLTLIQFTENYRYPILVSYHRENWTTLLFNCK